MVYQLNNKISQTIFRAYDIRGIVNQDLTEDNVYTIGRAYASEAISRGIDKVVVARDGRLSGFNLLMALSQGLLDSGCNVTNIGAVPTPVLYFATHLFKTGSGIMLTGSHNPPNYNGLKMMLDGDTLAEAAIQNLYSRIVKNKLSLGKGRFEKNEITEHYLEYITNGVKLKRLLKIVIDAGSGIAGDVAPALYRAMNCKVIELFCDVDGNFPNHHPDPSKPENLQDLIKKVKAEKADIGLAFDGDGDRLGVVTDQGEIISADRQMMLYAANVLSHNPDAEIIFDVKSSRLLAKEIKKYGGRPLMWKTGHSLIKAKMKKTGAPLAGEVSGHIFFNDRWFGFDDGLYTGARLLEIISQQKETVNDIFAQLPNAVSTPEINVPMTDDKKFVFVKNLIEKADFTDANIITLDGIRVEFNDSWGLLRCSNTTPCLVLRFEADNDPALQRIKDLFKQQMLLLEPKLILDF